MKVSLELFKSKTLVNGTNPIMVRISHNGKNKYVSTGISVKPKVWDKLKKRITCREENFRLKNTRINEELQRINSRVQWFINNNVDFDLDYIVSNRDIELYSNDMPLDINFDETNFLDLIKARVLSYENIKSRENYQAFFNKFKELFGDYVDARKINQYFANIFRETINKDEYSANYKNDLIKCFTSTYNYAVSNRWIARPYVFTIKKFPYKPNSRDVSEFDFSRIINCYKKQISANFRFNDYKSLAIFILDIAFQGLAPIDFANIKIKDLKVSRINELSKDVEKYLNDNEYARNFDNNQRNRVVIKIDTFRHKTGSYVPICCDFYSVRNIIANLVQGKSKDDYLLDCFTINKTYTEKQMRNRLGNYFMNHSRMLNETLRQYCNAVDEPHIKHLTYYYARHAFVNALDKSDIPHDLIRKMVGHKNTTLENSYINKPTDWEQSECIYNIFNSINSIYELECRNLDKKNIEDEAQRLIYYLTHE